jgi:hypothetical protein
MSGSTQRSVAWWQRKVESLIGSEMHCDVFVRSLCPPVGAHAQQERVIERLQEHEREGTVSDVSVHVWGEAICPSSCVARSAVGNDLLEKVQTIRDWSKVHDTDTVFEVREVHSSITDETYLKLSPPRICLLVSSGESPELVFPHETDGVNVCVTSFLDALERQTTEQPSGIESSA